MIVLATEEGFIIAPLMGEPGRWLRDLPQVAQADDDAARGRIHPTPTGGTEPEADADWREMVEPEMHALFQTHLDVVAADLKKVEPIVMREDVPEDVETDPRELDAGLLRIPREHTHAWIHTLNQASLALGARHEVTEADMNGESEVESPGKAQALEQIEFYIRLLGRILHETDL